MGCKQPGLGRIWPVGRSLLTRLLDSPDHVDGGRQLCGRPPGKSWPRGSASGPPMTYLPWVSAAFWNDLRASGVKVSSLEVPHLDNPNYTSPHGGWWGAGRDEPPHTLHSHQLHWTGLGLIRCLPTRRARVLPHSPCWEDPRPAGRPSVTGGRSRAQRARGREEAACGGGEQCSLQPPGGQARPGSLRVSP